MARSTIEGAQVWRREPLAVALMGIVAAPLAVSQPPFAGRLVHDAGPHRIVYTVTLKGAALPPQQVSIDAARLRPGGGRLFYD
jgi:hypothetical protein